MKVDTRLYSKLHAKVSISHDSVKFEPEMFSKSELEDFLYSLKNDVELIESVLEHMEYYEGEN